VVKAIKGRSSRLLRNEFAWLKFRLPTINQEGDMAWHDLALAQDAVRFLSNFGTDLLEPPLDAIDQHLAPIFRTKDHVVLTPKDDVAIRSGRHPGIYSGGLYNHQEGHAFALWVKPRASRAHFGEGWRPGPAGRA
jgi:hypothetical protein